MNLPPEKLKLYKEYLHICEYPYIEKLDDNEVLNIFSKENRLQFLSWVLIKLVPECESRLEEAKRNNKLESTIAKLLLYNGLCNKTEKDNFVTKTGMKLEQEIRIYNTIFFYLMSNYKNIDKENLTSEQLALLASFQQPNKAIFKNTIVCEVAQISSENLKKPSDKERKDIYSRLLTEIKNINEKIYAYEKDKSKLVSDDVDETNGLFLIEDVNTLKSEISNRFENFKATHPEHAIDLRVPKTANPLNLHPFLDIANSNVDKIHEVCILG